ncbi:uncharacterized protein FOBCDRAFT_37576 [Fusarium oxysporum Fo47]|uniref:uncharacterized protein n=1 Tax=Fusarium oxysporum Fo47 TaxID=660027 RepID=UPI002869CDD6|nr:uncharacterized protein FOBCDRAFT_37576 [Fusarium oxysporum Fo47]WJG35372.1 hypothetical protein FOBCDRAFT_37576 [Fusarium oxysporum Fo47]
MSRGDLHVLLLFMSIYPSCWEIWFGWTLINRHYTLVCIPMALVLYGYLNLPSSASAWYRLCRMAFYTGWAKEWT